MGILLKWQGGDIYRLRSMCACLWNLTQRTLKAHFLLLCLDLLRVSLKNLRVEVMLSMTAQDFRIVPEH